MTRARYGAPFTAALAVLVAACVNTDPDPYDGGPQVAEAGAKDAGPTLDFDAMVSGCRTCLNSPACASTVDSCNQDPSCAALLSCAYDTYCFNISLTDLANLPACATDCLNKNGLNEADPAITEFLPVLLCAQSPSGCATACYAGADQ